MAHLIDTSNNRSNIAYIGAKPWHGLGTELPADQPIETWRIAAGLDFSYELADVQFAPSFTGAVAFPGRKVVYRSDTLAPLSVVSDRYQAVQPGEVLEFFRDLTDDFGFTIETAGSLKGGSVVWALAKTGRSFLLSTDETRQYVLLMTSCDSSLATRATLTSVRVVCWNTLSAALHREAANLIVTRHNTRFDAGMTKRTLGLVDDTWAQFAGAADRMASKALKDVDVQEAILAIFGNPDAPLDKQPRAIGQVFDLFKGRGRGSNLPSANGTAWGGLHAVTEYVDHHARQNSPGARLASAWTGRGETLKRKALDTFIALAA